MEQGEQIDEEALVARHPGRENEVRRLAAAAGQYAQAARKMRRAGPSVADLARGDRLGDFEIEGLIAKGGMGAVYRATQLSLGRRAVALKVLPADRQTPEARARFEREALSLARLHHPNLAEVYGFGEQGGLLFFAMRLIDGPTLREVIEAQRRSPTAETRQAQVERFVGWAEDITSALDVLHTEGLVHRDIKPSNIMIEGPVREAGARPQGRAVLVDFGLVRPVESSELTQAGQSAATLGFAPPEQLLGHAVDERSDLFALGVTLHDLVTGSIPQEREQASVGLEPLDTLGLGVDSNLSAVVSKAADPEPRWRYQCTAGFAADLRAWRRGDPVSARRLRPAESFDRWLRRYSSAVWKAVGVTITAGLLVLGGAQVARGSRHFNAARVAYVARNLPELRARALQTPTWMAWLRIDALASRDAVFRLKSLGPGDPWYAAVQAMEEDDMQGALFAAASHLRVHGVPSAPLLLALLHSPLEDSYGPSSKRRQLRSIALRLCARLFFERPADSPLEMEHCRELRARLRAVWHSETFDRSDRLHATSALAGCGEVSDARNFVERAIDAAPASEERRLGFSAASAILDRAHSTGELPALDAFFHSPELITLLARGFRSFGKTPPLQRGEIFWAFRFSIPLAFALRAAGQDNSGLLAGLGPDCLAGLTDGTIRSASFEDLQLLAACKNPVLGEQLASTAYVSGLNPLDAGRILGWYGDDTLVYRAREGISLSANDSDRPQILATFDDALERASNHRIGVRIEGQPDADTLLGPAPPVAWRVLECVPGTSLEGDGLAAWSFDSPGPTTRGGACEVTLRYAQHRVSGDGGYPAIRLGRAGAAEVRLGFQTDAAEPGAHLLELSHLAARRPPYPFAGEAYLDVYVDGRRCAQALQITGAEKHTVSLPLPLEQLASGRHEISLRLNPRSTTTYRIYAVTLRAAGD